MSLHWVGALPFTLFILLSLFVFAGMVLMYKAVGILALTFERQANSKIFKPLFFLIAYSLMTVLFRQAISLGMVTFKSEPIEFFVNVSLGLVHAAVAVFLLYKILHDSKVIHRNY